MTNHAEEWLTIREAALQLGVSDLTVRRRIKAGTLAHRLEGGKYYVNLTVPSRPEAPLESVAGAEMDPALRAEAASDPTEVRSGRGLHTDLNLDALLHQHRQLAAAAGRADLLEEQLHRLEEQNASLREGIVALSNRNGWLESKLEERENAIKLLTDNTHRRPWWRRLLGAEASA